MSTKSIPKNSYMLWLRENRSFIKRKHFLGYTPKIVDGKKESMMGLLSKKCGQIWNALDVDTKEEYKTRLNNMQDGIDADIDTLELELDPDKMVSIYVKKNGTIYESVLPAAPTHTPKRTVCGKLKFQTKKNFWGYKLFKSRYVFKEGDDDMEYKGLVKDGVVCWSLDIPDDLLKIIDDNTNIDSKLPKIYCPNNCGASRKTLDGMYSHLGLKENAVDNCSKKQKIVQKKKYKSALQKLFNGETEIDFTTYCNNDCPPKYSVDPEPTSNSRKSIPKAVRTNVWNKYIETTDVKKLSGKCFVGCGTEITIVNFELGHVEAYSKGGSNKVDNLRPICSLCNKSMGTMNLFEFKETYGMGLKTTHSPVHEQASDPKTAEYIRVIGEATSTSRSSNTFTYAPQEDPLCAHRNTSKGACQGSKTSQSSFCGVHTCERTGCSEFKERDKKDCAKHIEEHNQLDPGKIKLKIVELNTSITKIKTASTELTIKKTDTNSRLGKWVTASTHINTSIDEDIIKIESIKKTTKQIINDLLLKSEQDIKLVNNRIEQDTTELEQHRIIIHSLEQDYISINDTFMANEIYLKDQTTEKQKYTNLLQEHIKNEEAARRENYVRLEKEVIKEMEDEKLKNEIKQRYVRELHQLYPEHLREQQTNTCNNVGNLINF
jgi:hypothetical protein